MCPIFRGCYFPGFHRLRWSLACCDPPHKIRYMAQAQRLMQPHHQQPWMVSSRSVLLAAGCEPGASPGVPVLSACLSAPGSCPRIHPSTVGHHPTPPRFVSRQLRSSFLTLSSLLVRRNRKYGILAYTRDHHWRLIDCTKTIARQLRAESAPFVRPLPRVADFDS